MKKIKLNKLEALDSALTREQLKGIMGGSGSDSTMSALIAACSGLQVGTTCSYGGYTGTCSTAGAVVYCKIVYQA